MRIQDYQLLHDLKERVLQLEKELKTIKEAKNNGAKKKRDRITHSG